MHSNDKISSFQTYRLTRNQFNSGTCMHVPTKANSGLEFDKGKRKRERARIMIDQIKIEDLIRDGLNTTIDETKFRRNN